MRSACDAVYRVAIVLDDGPSSSNCCSRSRPLGAAPHRSIPPIRPLNTSSSSAISPLACCSLPPATPPAAREAAAATPVVDVVRRAGEAPACSPAARRYRASRTFEARRARMTWPCSCTRAGRRAVPSSAAAAAKSRGLGSGDGAPLRARAERRVVLRDAAVPRARTGRLDARAARCRRLRRDAASFHAESLLDAGSGSTA